MLPYTHPGSDETLVIYMGDRWYAGHAPNQYVWLPMVRNASDSAGFTMAALDGKGDGTWEIADY